MKRKVLVIAILVIVLIVSLAVMQGCGKKKTDEVKPPIKTETTQPTEQKPATEQQTQQTPPPKVKKEVPPEQAKDYELQVAASSSYANIITEKNKLAQYGYETKITTTKKNGKLFYRLRLKGLYSAPEANELGKQLKAKFPSISDYWLAKVQ